MTLAVGFLALLGLCGAARADMPQPPPGPAQIVEEGMSKLMAISSHAGKADPQALIARLHAEIAGYIDFDRMADWVAGPLKQHMNPAQRQSFAVQLRQMFLSSLAGHLGGEGYSYQVLKPRMGWQAGEARVNVRIYQYNRPFARLEFLMHPTPQGAWQIHDVVANESSAVAYYRNYFNEQVRRRGLGSLLGQ
jgi:phospholipid transport system substrate-binding protein